ncbi:inner membrane symporter YicJ [mine drainage metagenome]|uniref:Inner membrane symporter YicJ n=1 Tax=mine drainage metagenome TaxID=410659 RepID=A0A1J5STW8_9ZZZZ
MNTQKLSTLEKVGFGAGDMAVNVVWSSMALIITFFYTDVFGLRPADIALLLILPRLIDAFADLLMGVVTDRYTTRWGRYRPYLLIMAVPFGLSVMMVFTTPHFAYAGKLAWAYGAYIVMMLCFTAVTIPYISLIGVLTEDPQERLSANGYRLFFAKVAAFMVTIVVPLLAARWGATHVARGYQVAMGLMAGMATLLFLFCFFTTTERVKHTVDPMPLRQQFRLLFKNDQWMVLGAVCVIGTIGYTIRGAVAAYYAKYYLGGGAALLSQFLTTGVVASILAMVASTWITKRFCKIKLFRWSQLVVGVLSAMLYFMVKPGAVVPAFILYFLVCFVVDLHAPVFWSAIAEAVDYGESKTGKRVAGLAFGGISFFQKTGMSLAGGAVGVLLTYYKYVPDHPQSAFTLNGIALMLSIIPGAFHILMGLLMFAYRITDRYYLAMRHGNAAKQDAA